MTPVQKNWNKSFFNGLAVEFWINAIPPEWTDQEVAFLTKHLRLRPG